MHYTLLIITSLVVLGFIFGTAFALEKHALITVVPGSKIQGCENESGCYNPVNLVVEVGTIITMRNSDDAVHTFTSDKFDSHLLINNMEYNWVAEQGTVTYNCALHPWAVGTITGIFVPTLDDLTYYPDWVVSLFGWYDEGKIDYITLINTIQYLAYKGVIE